jgi:hypothetical protein
MIMDGAVQRFQANPIVRYLLDSGDVDMNKLATMPFSDEDHAHFAQLIGYSVSGWGDLSYVSDAIWTEAHAAQAQRPALHDAVARQQAIEELDNAIAALATLRESLLK